MQVAVVVVVIKMFRNQVLVEMVAAAVLYQTVQVQDIQMLRE